MAKVNRSATMTAPEVPPVPDGAADDPMALPADSGETTNLTAAQPNPIMSAAQEVELRARGLIGDEDKPKQKRARKAKPVCIVIHTDPQTGACSLVCSGGSQATSAFHVMDDAVAHGRKRNEYRWFEGKEIVV